VSAFSLDSHDLAAAISSSSASCVTLEAYDLSDREVAVRAKGVERVVTFRNISCGPSTCDTQCWYELMLKMAMGEVDALKTSIRCS